MASGAASNRSASQPATSASAHDADAWEKEEELAATRRAVNALWNVPIGVGDNALWEVLRDVHFLLDSPGAHAAAHPGAVSDAHVSAHEGASSSTVSDARAGSYEGASSFAVLDARASPYDG